MGTLLQIKGMAGRCWHLVEFESLNDVIINPADEILSDYTIIKVCPFKY
jgi:hypothetical protein